jgi:hypothetical protein
MPVQLKAETPAESRPRRRWRRRRGVLVPTADAVALDLARVPDGKPWPWARDHLLPTIRGERTSVLDEEDLERIGFRPSRDFLTVELPPGVDVTFAVTIGVACLVVTADDISGWGVTPGDVVGHALANLRRLVHQRKQTIHVDDSDEYGPVRSMRSGPFWSAALLLLPDELTRIFGEQDQLFIPVYGCHLISLAIDVDRDLAADIVDIYGWFNPDSLIVGVPAFALRNGRLSAESLPAWEPSEDDDELLDELLD